MNREGVGVAAVLAGILIIVGAAKGTWRQVWTDLTGNAASSSSGSSAGATSSGSSAPGSGWISVGGGGVAIGPHILPVPLPTPVPGLQLQSYGQNVIPYTPAPGTNGYGAVPVQ